MLQNYERLPIVGPFISLLRDQDFIAALALSLVAVLAAEFGEWLNEYQDLFVYGFGTIAALAYGSTTVGLDKLLKGIAGYLLLKAEEPSAELIETVLDGMEEIIEIDIDDDLESEIVEIVKKALRDLGVKLTEGTDLEQP